jgi:hypothetical protein
MMVVRRSTRPAALPRSSRVAARLTRHPRRTRPQNIHRVSRLLRRPLVTTGLADSSHDDEVSLSCNRADASWQSTAAVAFGTWSVRHGTLTVARTLTPNH